VDPRDIVRISILVSFGALALAIAAWLLAFALAGGPSGASPFAAVVLVGGLLLLLAGVVVLGGAGADAVWARLQRLRGR
jgi:hypothetical protein